jgi:hypothetical protein
MPALSSFPSRVFPYIRPSLSFHFQPFLFLFLFPFTMVERHNTDESNRLAQVLPMNTGAEAVESALKLARKWAYLRAYFVFSSSIPFCFPQEFRSTLMR